MANELNHIYITPSTGQGLPTARQKVPGGNDPAFSDTLAAAMGGLGNASRPRASGEGGRSRAEGHLAAGGPWWELQALGEGETGPLPGAFSLARRNAAHAYRDSRLQPGSGTGEPTRPPGSPGSLGEQIRKYKEDQLLANPGGDHYFLDRPSGVIDRSYDHGRLTHRVGKDLKDAFQNFLNIFRDLGFGSTHRYLDPNGDVRSAKDRGLLSHLVGFFREVGEALKPEGPLRLTEVPARMGGFFKRLFVDAIGRELIGGVSHSAINVAKDAALTGLNLAEVVPDATLGNVEVGRKITTEAFDDLQVVVSYATDVLPTKDGWERVYAPGASEGGKKLPLLFNLKTPEQHVQDPRWREVRNTPFRKAIETLGAIGSKLLTFTFLSRGIWGASRKRD